VTQPSTAQGMLDEAYRALMQDDVETALALALQLQSRMPGHAAVLRLLGLTYVLKGAAYAELGCRFLGEAKAKGVDDIDVNIGLARCWLHRERFVQVHMALNDASRTADADYREIIDFHRGLCFVAEQDWDRATALFEKLRASAEHGKLAIGWLGVIAACQNDDAKALSQFEQLPLNDQTLQEEDYSIFRRHYRDILANRRPHSHAKRILTLRHPAKFPNFYQLFLDWVARNYPHYESLFEFRLLPCPPLEFDNYALHLPWLQDPVENWSAQAYAQAYKLEISFEQHGIKVINPVSRLSHAGKHEGAQRIASAGLRTPRMARIADIGAFRRDRGGLEFPFFIREDWGHGGKIERIENDAQLARIDVDNYRRPIAVELIDAKGADGLYRKYRYFAIGDYGISYHLVVADNWITHRDDSIYNASTRAEELAYTACPDPNHELFQKAMRALELDYAAFDYGYDRAGHIVVWEANPYPFISRPRIGAVNDYVIPAIHRTLATRLLFYLEQAGIAPPPELRLVATYDPAGEARIATYTWP
jgi:glutathione synthase/RimK-type ligase-like ATP-grasp enzyme